MVERGFLRSETTVTGKDKNCRVISTKSGITRSSLGTWPYLLRPLEVNHFCSIGCNRKKIPRREGVDPDVLL